MKNNTTLYAAVILAGLASTTSYATENEKSSATFLAKNSRADKLETVQVWGDKNSTQTLYIAPTTTVTAEQMQSINLTGVEDAIGYDPSLIVRRRFIGDANGVLGMRNSNMFQSARSSVYADGVPLHYHLQTRWNGSPRWSLVAPDEVESIDIIYGPYSAAYSGNSMGGVVNIKTKVPTERSVIVQGALFNQFYDRLDRNDNYLGGRGSLTYGDKIGNLSVLAFYNHLENEGQPQSHYYVSSSSSTDSNSIESAEAAGAIAGVDANSNPVLYYGDSGTAKSSADLFKIKLTYELDEYQFRFLSAYEDRDNSNSPRSFIVDENGDSVWSGLIDNTFAMRSSNFSVSEGVRKSLLLGAGVSGPLAGSDSWTFDWNVSDFKILKDLSLSSSVNPNDATYDASGSVYEYDNTGWQTFDLNVGTEKLAEIDGMTLTMGLHQSEYSLANTNYNSDNYLAATKDSIESTSGGSTKTHAIFAQYGWQFTPAWDIALGARYEKWEAKDGYYGGSSSVTSHPDRQESGVSPKFSLGFVPSDNWAFRYSLAKAIRFPIVEELYDNNRRTTSSTIGDITLEPEIGIHNNFMFERNLNSGYARINIFYDQIDDAIYSYTNTSTNATTFQSVNEMVAKGIEFVLDSPRIFNDRLSSKFNITYTDAKTTKNDDTSFVGKVFPRMPKWRSNLLLTWKQTDTINVSGGIRYASNSYGNLDNTDTASEVYGAQDDYLFINAKVNWNVTKQAKVAFGMDNMNNDIAYVAHPWPGRTVYLEGKYEF